MAHGHASGNIIVNSSRAVLYASDDQHFSQAARIAALQTRDALGAAQAEIFV
jgi:orotidine-5'-phosphate decarboxylase